MPIVFESSNPRVIQVTGRMPMPAPASIRVTGLRPGRAQALLTNKEQKGYPSLNVTVVCDREPAVQPAEPRQTAKIGQPVALRAETRIAGRTTFTWYHGRVGDMSAPIAASGPEIPFVTNAPGQHHVWVMATTPCSSSTAQFTVDAVAPKRRGARQ